MMNFILSHREIQSIDRLIQSIEILIELMTFFLYKGQARVFKHLSHFKQILVKLPREKKCKHLEIILANKFHQEH